MRTCILAISFCFMSSCFWPAEKDTPLFCDATTPCDYAAFPALTFCDTDGSIEGVTNTCIEPPQTGCDDSAMCTTASAPICDATSMECRACAGDASGDAECAAKDGATPVCVAGACEECRTSTECGGAAPICDDTQNACRVCTDDAAGDAECAALDSAAPRCTSDGRCVECEGNSDCGGGTSPICDNSANTCRGCAAHGECSSEVCDDVSGACVAEGDIVYVDGGAGVDGAACGTSTSPCATIAGAQGGLVKVSGARRTVRVRSGVYVESVTVDGGGTVAFVGPATVSPPLNLPGFFVRNGADVTMELMTVANASGNTDADGVRCENSGTAIRLLRSTLSGNDAAGVQSVDCTVTIERSIIDENQGGGIDLSNSNFTLRNNFIVRNGTVSTPFGGLRVSNSGAFSPQVLEFNTIARNASAGGGNPSGVDCFVSAGMTAGNNIVYGGVGGGPTLSNTNCSWVYSDIEGGQAGTGNIDMDPQFVNMLSGNFHIGDASPCRNIGDPAATLATDIDGDARPEGGRHDMGADEVTP